MPKERGLTLEELEAAFRLTVEHLRERGRDGRRLHSLRISDAGLLQGVRVVSVAYWQEGAPLVVEFSLPELDEVPEPPSELCLISAGSRSDGGVS